MKKIANKAQFTKLFFDGLLGNRWPVYNSAQEIPQEVLTVNVRGRSIAFPTVHNVPVGELSRYDDHHYYFNPVVTDYIENSLLIQGEVGRTPEGLALHYSTLPGKRMKEGLAEDGRSLKGLAAKLTLQHHLWPKSYRMIMDLLDEYDAVVEFSTYRVELGDIPGHNTIIWEVRSY